MNPNREEALFALTLAKPAEKQPAFLDAMCEGDAAFPENPSTPQLKYLVKRSSVENTPAPKPIIPQKL